MSNRTSPYFSRRQTIQGLLATTALGITANLSSCRLSSSKENFDLSIDQDKSRPNILFFAVDDLRPQLGCYGHPQMVTPHIDRLAAAGVIFNRTYCNVPICGASRVSMLTGIRPTRRKLLGARTRKTEDLPKILSLPEHLKNNGYITLSRGKIYHFPDDDPQGWSEPPWIPEGAVGPWGYATSEKKGTKSPTESTVVADHIYADGQVANQAISDLKRLRDNDKPFFLAVGFWRPHLPLTAPKKYWDFYQRDMIDLVENPFRSHGAPDVAFPDNSYLRSFAGVPKMGKLSESLARKIIHGYYACISYVDAQVGKVIAELDRLQLRKNTIIVLWGDHGYHLGEHGLWEKHTLFETTLRAPLIISTPFIEAGVATHALTEFIDIYPSLCELCHIPLPGHIEGQSFLPFLKNSQSSGKEAVFSRFRDGISVRTNRYRYTEYRKLRWPQMLGIETQAYARMLYDHAIDPDETMNIAELADNRQLVHELSTYLNQL